MSLDVQILGAAELRRLAAQVRETGDKGLGREMGKALAQAAKPVERSVRSEYAALPARGGYSALFSKSLRFRTSVRGQTRQSSFRLLTFADGTHQRRDINTIEGGKIRHPVYGRSRRGKAGRRIGNPWAVTVVKGGYFRRGTDSAADQAEREMVDVLAEFSARLIK